MRPDHASSTAEAGLAMRAMESARSSSTRLFRDENAKKLLRKHHRILIALCAIQPVHRCIEKLFDWKYPGAPADFICRTRFIDDWIEHGISQGARNVVILGAGYDTRSFRLATRQDLHVIEIDHPATQAAKLKRAKQSIAPALFERIQFVAHDLSESFPPASRYEVTPAATIFIMEGLTGYLSPASLDSLFASIRSISTAGSMIIFDYLDQKFLEGRCTGKAARKASEYLRRVGEPFRMGWHPEELGEYCAARGFQLAENRSYLEFEKDYLASLNRRLDLYDFGHIAVAIRQ